MFGWFLLWLLLLFYYYFYYYYYYYYYYLLLHTLPCTGFSLTLVIPITCFQILFFWFDTLFCSHLYNWFSSPSFSSSVPTTFLLMVGKSLINHSLIFFVWLSWYFYFICYTWTFLFFFFFFPLTISLKSIWSMVFFFSVFFLFLWIYLEFAFFRFLFWMFLMYLGWHHLLFF